MKRKLLILLLVIVPVSVLGALWALIQVVGGSPTRNSMRSDLTTLLTVVADDFGDERTEQFCRHLIEVDWENVCASQVGHTTNMHSECGAHVDVRRWGVFGSDGFSAVGLYDFASFDELAELGFLNVVDGIVPQGDREASAIRRFQTHYSALDFTFHRCTAGNFIRIGGAYE